MLAGLAGARLLVIFAGGVVAVKGCRGLTLIYAASGLAPGSSGVVRAPSWRKAGRQASLGVT
jgi:hypothetical protein